MNSNKPIKKRPGVRRNYQSNKEKSIFNLKNINKKHLAIVPVVLLAFFLIYAVNAGQLALGYGGMLTSYETDSDYYFGYDLSWKGPIKPVITDVKLRRFAISEYNQEGDPAFVKPFIDEKGKTGILCADTYASYKEDGLISYKDVQKYKMKDKQTQLVLRLNIQEEEGYADDFSEVVVYYTVLGIKKKQAFPFDGFILQPSDCCDIPH